MSLAAAGLVGQVTTRTFPHLSVRGAQRAMNRERRIRRMRRVVIAAADATRDLPGFRIMGILATLTYREDAPWRSDDVGRYVSLVRKYLRRRGIPCRYQWVIELTQRGRPHYHVLFWVPPGTRIPKPDESGMWLRGLSRIERARRPVGYLVKYATKGTEGVLPFGARLFGVGGVEESVRLARHRAGLPAWLDDRATEGEYVRRVVRVGWVERGTGLVHLSPYRVQFLRDSWGFVVVVITQKETVQ